MPNLQYLKGLKLAHPVTANEQFDISLLIGVDYYWQIVQDEVIRGDGPIAVKSKLGYLLSGPVHSNVPASAPIHVANVMITHKTEEFDLERFWTIESLGITPIINDQKEHPLLEYQGKRMVDMLLHSHGRTNTHPYLQIVKYANDIQD